MRIKFFPELVVVAQFTIGDISIRDIIVVRDIYKERNLGIFSNVNI